MTDLKKSAPLLLLMGLLLIHLCDAVAMAQPPLGTLSGNSFVIADRRATLAFTQPGWALTQAMNNYTGAPLMKGAGYYVLGGLTPVPDGPGVAFSQAADLNARLTIVQNTPETVSFYTIGRFKRYGDGADGGLTIRRDYSYTRDSGKLTNRTQIDFERDTTVYTLSATMDLDRGFDRFAWQPSYFWAGRANSWRRQNGGQLTGPIVNPPGTCGNWGRMWVSSLATLDGNWADIFNPAAGGIGRAFDDPRQFQDIAFWTNLGPDCSDPLEARTLEAHYLNVDSRYVEGKGYTPTTVRKGAQLVSRETLFFHPGDANTFLWEKRGGSSFEAEQSYFSHQVGRSESGGWSCDVNKDRNAGFLAYGPYTTDVAPRLRTAKYALKIDSTSGNNDTVLTLSVTGVMGNSIQVMGARDIRRRDFLQGGSAQVFEVPFRADPGMRFEFRVYWTRKSYALFDRVVVN